MQLTSREREIIDACPIDVYVASAMAYEYPCKLMKPAHASHAVAESCDTLIMDSGIGDDDLTNRDVLHEAHEYGADYVIAKDYLHDQDRTTESVREFYDEYSTHPCTATPLVPLQPPYLEHWRELDCPGMVVLGGMMRASGRETVQALREFRDAAGNSVHVHGLGVGNNPDFLQAVRENPELVDSVDCSTFEQMPVNGTIADSGLKQHKFQYPRGKHSSVFRWRMAQWMVLQLNYLLGPFADVEFDENHTLGAFA